MNKTIDCLLIGHNEMDFAEYETVVRRMGLDSGAYRDLNLNFIRCNNRPYTVSELFNLFYYQAQENDGFAKAKFFNVAESFLAAIAYLGTYLYRRGYTFDYVNSFRFSKTQLAEKLTRQEVLSVAITTTLYVSEFPIIEVIDFIRAYNRTAKIIVGGPFVSTRTRTMAAVELEYLFKTTIGADIYVNSDQGEATLVKILGALKSNLPLENINNIYYKSGKELKATPVVRENNILSENMVDWSLFGLNPAEYINIRTAISCPFSCSFCGFPQHAGQHQTASVAGVEVELKQLDKIKTLQCIHFIDDTFNIPVKRFKDLLSMMIKNNFDFKWHSYFRCQFADREMVELMKASGCEGVFLGIESGSEPILKKMNKAADIPKYLEGIQRLKEAGIVTFGNFITGFPGETEETARDTIDFIEKSGLDFFRAQLWYCEPITPIWKEREVYNIKGKSFHWSHQTMDSQKACDLVETIFLRVKNSTWVPQYNFDFDSIWHLVHRGMSLEQLKEFLKCFNRGVKEKLLQPSRREASYEVIEQIKTACSPQYPHSHARQTDLDENRSSDHPEAGFEFM